MRAVVYTRVSTEEQGDSRLSLDSQAQWCSDEAARRGWTIEHVTAEVASTGQPIHKRPELAGLLDRLNAGQLDALIVRRLDRLCRSIAEFQKILEASHTNDWQLVMLEPQVDTTTPYGRAFASIGAVFAQLERELTGQRVHEAFEAKRARGESCGGAPPYDDPDTIQTIVRLQAAGVSQHAIARELNEQHIPTLKGGPWRQSTIRSILSRTG